MKLFADDTSIVKGGLDEDELLSSMDDTQSLLLEWFCANELSVNLDKTAKMLFTHRTTTLVNPESVRFLGVTLDPALSWEGHIDYLAKKISKNIFLIRNLVNLLPGDILRMAYFPYN